MPRQGDAAAKSVRPSAERPNEVSAKTSNDPALQPQPAAKVVTFTGPEGTGGGLFRAYAPRFL